MEGELARYKTVAKEGAIRGAYVNCQVAMICLVRCCASSRSCPASGILRLLSPEGCMYATRRALAIFCRGGRDRLHRSGRETTYMYGYHR